MIDRIIEGIKQTRCPVCVGLDTLHTYLPDSFEPSRENPLKSIAEALFDFNKQIIDAVYDIVPSVKIQSACYERYGTAGIKAFSKTIRYAKKRGLIVIADVKRGDIGSTAAAYSTAYLSGSDFGGGEVRPFDADFVTVNAYLGSDGVVPFLKDCKTAGKGIFVLVRTSNPSGAEIQNLKTGIFRKPLYEVMAKKVEYWGKDLLGEYGYSSVGAVVGATCPKEAERLRRSHPSMFFLVPGYGAQGAAAKDLAASFDKNGLGAVVNSSRGIILAYRDEKHAGLSIGKAAREAVIEMKTDIESALLARGIKL